MPTIIDELIVLFKIDSTQAKKAADASTATVQKITKTAKVSAEDQERIAASQEQRRREREKRDAKVATQREKDEKRAVNESAKRAEEYGDKVKGIALGLSGAFLGFETFKGAVAAFNSIATSTAQIGRKSEDLGQSVHDLQTWELAVKKAGGVAEDADATFSALSQTFTGSLIRGESSPFLQLLQQMGVAARDAKGQIKPLAAVLLELGDHMQARGLSRANAFNLFTGAGGSAGVFDLLYDKNRNQFLNESSLAANVDQSKIDRAQRFQNRREVFKQKVGAAMTNATDNVLQLLLDHSLEMTNGTFGVDPNSKEGKKLNNSPYISAIMSSETRNGLPQGLLQRLLLQESSLNPAAVNKTSGALGIAQLKPKYHPNAGKNPVADIDDAGATLAKLIKDNHGDVYMALAAYNDGQTNLDAHLRKKELPQETADYVRRVGNLPAATPDVNGTGDTSNVSHDNSVTVTTGPVTIQTQATDAGGIAKDFSSAMREKGALISQYNNGMTP